MDLLISGIAILIVCAGIGHVLFTIKVAVNAKKLDAQEMSSRKHGLFIEHGMVFNKQDGSGVTPQQKLSDYFYDSISK
ncbi:MULTISPECIES: hypothetical protein [Pseudomonadota]|uniref:hypothetical protein n=1 Tax=Pseudomonadota TaxID=1224 RepID=UPI000586B124|nr:hypothetical protein [Alcanivorax sp. DG881]